MCQVIHEDVVQYSTRFLDELSRYNYVTPTSYLELLGIFSKLIGMKKNELVVARKRTKTGLDKVLPKAHYKLLSTLQRLKTFLNKLYILPYSLKYLVGGPSIILLTNCAL